MRISEIEIAGKKYKLTFNLFAEMEIVKKYGNTNNIGTALKEMPPEKALSEVLEILMLLLKSGKKYIELTEKTDVEIPTFEELTYLIDAHDLPEISEIINECISNGKKTEINSELKNAETTETQN